MAAFRAYCEDVKNRRFPDDDHSYHMKAGEKQRLDDLLEHSPQ